MTGLPYLTVPTNWDPALVDRLDPARTRVVYGKLQQDLVGGGRVAAFLPSVSMRAGRRHIRRIRDRGLSFNYLLNATCLENRECTRSWRRGFDRLLSWVVDAGASSVTVSTPFLCEIIKRSAPHLEVMVSTMAHVSSPSRALWWRDLGADGFTLAVTDVNRDFPLLREFRATLPGALLVVIGNLTCIPGCPHSYYQSNIASHASQSGHRSRGLAIDYCVLSCCLDRINDPALFLMGSWIRPEDQRHYGEVGIDSVKLVDRTMPTEALCRIIDAYATGRYDGNLLDLLSDPSQNAKYGRRDMARAFKYFFRPRQINVLRLYAHRDAFAHQPVTIDNRGLDGFLDFFVEGKCQRSRCAECGYCARFAEEVLTFAPAERQAARQRLQALKDDLLSGRLSRYLGSETKCPRDDETGPPGSD